jgi:hypothetical protein
MLVWVLDTIYYLSVKLVLIGNCDMSIVTDTRSSIRHMSSYFKNLIFMWSCRQLDKSKEIKYVE